MLSAEPEGDSRELLVQQFIADPDRFLEGTLFMGQVINQDKHVVVPGIQPDQLNVLFVLCQVRHMHFYNRQVLRKRRGRSFGSAGMIC